MTFGDVNWTDYDFTYDVRKSAGPAGFGGSFRVDEGKLYLVQIGGPNNHHYIDRWAGGQRDKWIRQIPGTIRPRDWYHVRISLRGQRISIYLEGHLLAAWTDDFSRRGYVSLRFFNGAGEFKNIKVAAPDGTVLWEGPPDLPKK